MRGQVKYLLCCLLTTLFATFMLLGTVKAGESDIPTMKDGMYNAAQYMIVKNGGQKYSYSDYQIVHNRSNTNVHYEFTNIPMPEDAEYTFQADVTMRTKFEQSAWGPRIKFRTGDWENIYVAFCEKSILILPGDSGALAKYSMNIEIGKSYDVVISSGSEWVSVWVDGKQIFDKVDLSVEGDTKASPGIQFEKCNATLSNMKIYGESVVLTQKTLDAFENSKDPVFKPMTRDMYNGAQYMVVMNGGKEYGYQNYTIKHSRSNTDTNYYFENIPLPEYAEYTFQADVTMQTKFEQPAWGPRLKFRARADKDVYIAFCEKSILILPGDSGALAKYSMDMKIGQTYNVAITSTTDYVSVWLDGKLIFNKVPLSDTGEKTKASPGIRFEKCNATISNIKIYGETLVFTEDTFDPELRNNKWFNMNSLPQIPSGNVNLFQNVKLGKKTTSGLAVSYENNIFSSMISNSYAQAVFVDPTDSSSLNGLQRSDTYVWSSKVKIKDMDESVREGENKQDIELVYVFKRSDHPSASSGNAGKYYMSLVLVQDWLDLRVWSNSVKVQEYRIQEFKMTEGQEYQVDMLMGSTWIKIWINHELVLTAYDLPSYSPAFEIGVRNLSAEVSENKVYKVESENTELRTAEIVTVKQPGNTLKEMESVIWPMETEHWKQILGSVLIVIPFTILTVCVIVFIIKKNSRNKAKSSEAQVEESKIEKGEATEK